MLHHRQVNQRVDWQQIEMTAGDDGRYRATIPGKAIVPTWDYMYYIEAQLAEGGGTLWPSWQEGPPYVVVELNRTPE